MSEQSKAAATPLPPPARSPTVAGPAARRPLFHELTVAAVEPLTDDAVAVALEVPPGLRDTFAFRPGQHLTLRPPGATDRRSYSICSTPDELAGQGRLRIGVRQIPGGALSGYLVGASRPGDIVAVLPPLGSFTTQLDPARTRHYAAVAAGSGITPVLSIVATALCTEPASRFTVLYGNRYTRSVMFADELADLKDRYRHRLHLVHALSREPGGSTLLSGRLDPTRLESILGVLLNPSTVDEWFLCGPYAMVDGARDVLARLARPDAAIHTELFYVEDTPPERAAVTPEVGAAWLTVRFDGREARVAMRPGERVLDAALRVWPELPYSCTGGVCATCRARLVGGQVRLQRNFALEPGEVAAGFVLTCQSIPLTDELVVDYDIA
ncbi:MAG: 2Fe-2S iron-sulfur cluster binding domain-containing protein [Micromonosporaceae bacterium]|nr:2Fe-2S iron-sulfur cluster binding domain-containing protein [Micromonosporaceae bacterium]